MARLIQKPEWRLAMKSRKHIVTVALLLNLGAAVVYAQDKPVKLTFSGTTGAGAINLQYSGTHNSEDDSAGTGALGAFTFRNVRAINNLPSPSSTCSGSTKFFFTSVAGGAVFRFADGSLLKVTLTQATDCVDVQAQQGSCTMTFQITGGTGRFTHATGILTLTELVLPVVADSTHNPVYFATTGTITGTVSGLAGEDERGDARY
jgi:hypothetical protein